jgi:hypothetical protein
MRPSPSVDVLDWALERDAVLLGHRANDDARRRAAAALSATLTAVQ